MVPEDGFGGKPELANRQARIWGLEVNGRVHSEIQAVPAERLQEERPLMRPLPSLRPPLCRGELRKVDRLQTVRFGSAYYSVPTSWVGRTLEIMVEDGEVVIGLDGNEITRHQLQPPGRHLHSRPALQRPSSAAGASDSGSDRHRACLHRPGSGRRGLPALGRGRRHLPAGR